MSIPDPLLTSQLPDMAMIRLIGGDENNPDLASQLFQRAESIIPKDQDRVVTVSPDAPVVDAVKLMLGTGYSQLPVISGNKVLGLFSFRSLARQIAVWEEVGPDIGRLSVQDFMEQPTFVHLKEELSRIRESLDRDGVVLVGDPERLLGLITVSDGMGFLYRVANPFVLICEIELAVRGLMRECANDEMMESCIASVDWPRGRPPRSSDLDQMTFGQYGMIVCDESNWSVFGKAFGGNPAWTHARLKKVADLRNSLFHFRRDVTVEEYEDLVGIRNWLLSRVEVADLRKQEGEK